MSYPCLQRCNPEDSLDYNFNSKERIQTACIPGNCANCGFNPAVAEYRMNLLKEQGLTKMENGLEKLVLPRLGAM